MKLPGGNERWENWMQFVQSRIVPKFTSVGFKVVKTPASVNERLQKVVQNGINNWDSLITEEDVDDAIYNKYKLSPKMISRTRLWDDIHAEMLPYHEEWSGVKLFPTSIYGIRLYQNGSSLVMHYDKVHMCYIFPIYLIISYHIIS